MKADSELDSPRWKAVKYSAMDGQTKVRVSWLAENDEEEPPFHIEASSLGIRLNGSVLLVGPSDLRDFAKMVAKAQLESRKLMRAVRESLLP